MNLWSRPKQKPAVAKVRVDRRERRYSVPVLSVRITAELITPTCTYHGVLWDISTSGACIQTYEVIPIGITCTLRLHQYAGPQIVERQVRLLWSDDVMRAHYVGMSFDEPIPVDSSTFLGTLIENSMASQEGPD
jgi:hypothetical protein